MLSDFEKAFATLSSKLIFKRVFFKIWIINEKWIKTFYNGTKPCGLQNEFTYDCIYLQKGYRYVDTTSLYLLCSALRFKEFQ